MSCPGAAAADARTLDNEIKLEHAKADAAPPAPAPGALALAPAAGGLFGAAAPLSQPGAFAATTTTTLAAKKPSRSRKGRK